MAMTVLAAIIRAIQARHAVTSVSAGDEQKADHPGVEQDEACHGL